MSNTRSSGKSLFPPTDPESLLCAASAEKRRLAKIAANTTEPNIHVPSTSLPSTLFHTPTTSSPGTPTDLPFTPSLLRTRPMADLPITPNTLLPSDGDPPKDADPPKNPSSSKGGGSSSSKSANKASTADHYVELVLKLQHTAALQLQEERQHNIEQRRADRECIARLENTLFEVVTKAKEREQERLTPAPRSSRLDLQKFRIADGPAFTGPFHAIEPFLNWIRQLQVFFTNKDISLDNDKIKIAGGLIQDTILLDFYLIEGPLFIEKSWNSFKSRLFEVALPQGWRTTLKTKLRQLTIGSTESFITFSGKARTLQSLINFDDSPTKSPGTTKLLDFDLAEYVVLGLTVELRAEITKFTLLDANPFVYSSFEKRVASFDEVIVRPNPPRAPRATTTTQPTSSSSPDPMAWRVHAWLDSLAHGPSPASAAGKSTQPPAGRAPFRSASVAAVTDSQDSLPDPLTSDSVDAVDALDIDQQFFEEAAFEDSLPPNLSAADVAIMAEINTIRAEVAGIQDDKVSMCSSNYCSDLGRDPFDDTPPPS
ncbi:hypothetical protein PSTG_17435 [Puccinia striiformis f. sp. tritici PST-78]|uniref:Uncharacterized protein n=1 Tax=Puccinia striiformis f. sp. tritici PST-78 TaxID=1165861 RepID=A0A0L0UQA9_9BASI|nr:hypothetical protein PSTG_17435 [Puccinia striiformis f. sp. tritici PST-78]